MTAASALRGRVVAGLGRLPPGAALIAVTAALVLCWAGEAPGQMPDARSMSGVPLPTNELPAGTVVVRIVRDQLSNYVPNQRVELSGGGRTEAVTTDAEGRAEFKGMPSGVVVRAVAVVDGQRLESRPFEVPAGGGVRLLLAASTGDARPDAEIAPPALAGPGAVMIGGDSRVVVQFADDVLEVFYLFEFVNPGSTPAAIEPLVFEMPAEADGVAVLEGSSPQASAAGGIVTIHGPFAPGTTSVQIAYNLTAPSGRAIVRQRLPVTLQQLALFVQKVPGVTLTSTQVGDQREMAGDGRTFLVALGPAVKAGDTIAFEVAGVPRHASWPRNLALAIAAVVLAAGAMGAARGPGRGGQTAERQRLDARREELFAEMLALERREQSGTVSAGAAADRRAALTRELELVYGALDTGVEPVSGVQGPAA